MVVIQMAYGGRARNRTGVRRIFHRALYRGYTACQSCQLIRMGLSDSGACLLSSFVPYPQRESPSVRSIYPGPDRHNSWGYPLTGSSSLGKRGKVDIVGFFVFAGYLGGLPHHPSARSGFCFHVET